MTAELDFKGFLEKLKPFSNIAITAPAGADGDSVGTQSSLRELILQAYPTKRVRIVNEEPCPVRYRVLSQSAEFEVSADILKRPAAEWPDLMLCVDGGSSRIGPDTTQIWKAAKSRGQVDHHALGGGESYDFRLYDPKAAATTEIVFRFAKATNLKITASIAQGIYIGLVFDTGLFKHSNTTPQTLQIASELLAVGFDHTSLIESAMLLRSPAAFKMLRSVLGTAEFELDGRYVWGVLDQKQLLASGGDADDREGLIDNLFLVRGCEIAAFYFEKSPKEWKMSFRARGRDVAQLARSLNEKGGGHKLAAGCTLHGEKDEVLAQCHAAVRKVLTT